MCVMAFAPLFHPSLSLSLSLRSSLREREQKVLYRLVHRTLERHPDLYYYQGFHELCTVIYMVLGEELAYYAIDKLCVHYFRFGSGDIFVYIISSLYLSGLSLTSSSPQ